MAVKVESVNRFAGFVKFFTHPSPIIAHFSEVCLGLMTLSTHVTLL